MAKDNQTFYVDMKVLSDFKKRIKKENHEQDVDYNKSSKINHLMQLYIEKGE